MKTKNEQQYLIRNYVNSMVLFSVEEVQQYLVQMTGEKYTCIEIMKELNEIFEIE